MLRSPARGTGFAPFGARLLVPLLMLAVMAPPALLLAWLTGPDVVNLQGHAASSAAVVLLLAGMTWQLGRNGWQRRDGRALLGAFASALAGALLAIELAALLLDRPATSTIVRLSGLLVIPAGALVLLATRARFAVRPGRELVVLRTAIITTAIVGAAGALALSWQGLLPGRIGAGSPAALMIAAGGIATVLALAWSTTQTALLTRRRLDGLLSAGLLLLAPALGGMAVSAPGEARWGVAHALLFMGAAMMTVQLTVDLTHPAASRPLTGGVRATSLVERSSHFLGARVSALVERLQEKDPTTAGHVERVAVLAVQVGEHLRLSTGRLRLLAAGALLHDIGKLSVPTEILTKPGPLTAEEFALVQRHPADGRHLLSELGGFHPLILDLVELHHERADGTGYPHGRTHEELPLEVRILAVADVFDALTADRPYRQASSAADALAELDSQAGAGLDPRCVAALRAVLSGEQVAEIEQRVRPGARALANA